MKGLTMLGILTRWFPQRKAPMTTCSTLAPRTAPTVEDASLDVVKPDTVPALPATPAEALVAATVFYDRLSQGTVLPTLPPVSRCPGDAGGAADWINAAVQGLNRLGDAKEFRSALEAGRVQAQFQVNNYFNNASTEYCEMLRQLRAASDRCVRPAGYVRIDDIALKDRVEWGNDVYLSRPLTAHDLAFGKRKQPIVVGVLLHRLAADHPAAAELATVDPDQIRTGSMAGEDEGWSHRQRQVAWLYLSRKGDPAPIYLPTGDIRALTEAMKAGKLSEVLK
jgi:hypothetical protein